MRKQLAGLPALLVVVAGATALLGPGRSFAVPSATDDATYDVFARVFPDPHGCVRGAPAKSRFAKGTVCAAQYVQWDEALDGIRYLQQRFPRFVELVNLREALANDPAYAAEEFRSAGLPQEDMTRDKRDLYVIKVTDAKSPIPKAKRKHFAYSLSIHGIERAGLEGGLRAAEDLVTWAACEVDAAASPSCALEGPFPKRILEPSNSGPTAGEVLREAVVYFVLSNPDGWHRGELTEGGVSFQRYNGNGMDLNRDWPGVGYIEEQYTPWSEPETRGYGRYLLGERAKAAAGRFAGGIDLHGMLSSHSFSFTLLGAGQRDYRKNAITVDTAISTYRDSEARLSWSPLIGTGDTCPGPVPEPYFGRTWMPMCSDQWGTVWDTIAYQVTGSFGDWMDSPIGLDSVGIDNEMAMSHLAPNTVFDPDMTQLHVDGNKGLVFSQIASLLHEKPVTYDPPGRIAYVLDQSRVRHAGGSAVSSKLAALPAQAATAREDPNGVQEFTFEVRGPDKGVHNGGLTVEVTFANVRGNSPETAVADVILDFCGAPDHPGETGECREVARYFNQSANYLQAGARVDLNDPLPGPYRVRASEGSVLPSKLAVSFSKASAYPTPDQAPYNVSRMDFFSDLNEYVPAAEKLQPLTVAEILARPAVLSSYDTLVVADRFMPAAGTKTAYANALNDFVAGGGNLMLTDGALAGLPSLVPALKDSHVTKGYYYAGWIDFDDGEGNATYEHPLARGVDKEGTAEGQASIGDNDFLHRHQTYEPVPIGYKVPVGDTSCSSDRCDSANWIVDTAAWKAAGGVSVGRTFVHRTPTGERPASAGAVGTSLGELKLGKGVIRIVGALLPEPTEANYHPYGLASYSLTYTGYQVFENAVVHTRTSKPSVKGVRRTAKPLPATGAEDVLALSIALLGAASGLAFRARGKRARR